MNPRNDKTAFEYAEYQAGAGNIEMARIVLEGQNAVKHGISRHYERRFYYDTSAFCLLGKKISVELKTLKTRGFYVFLTDLHPVYTFLR